jgi:hypothetical protein
VCDRLPTQRPIGHQVAQARAQRERVLGDEVVDTS